MTLAAYTIRASARDGHRIFPLAPTALAYFAVDFTDMLDTSETLSTATWTVATGLSSVDPVLASPIAKVKLYSGTVDTDVLVTCKVTTTGGLGHDIVQTFTVQVRTVA